MSSANLHPEPYAYDEHGAPLTGPIAPEAAIVDSSNELERADAEERRRAEDRRRAANEHGRKVTDGAEELDR